jgi:two-component system nitrogen regulation response regulator GlnG
MAEATESGTLLVIDDDEAVGKLIAAIFREEHFNVEIAGDGDEGVRLAEAVSPDVVLLDVRLPGSNGLEVLERLKARCSSLPVVMLTALHDLKTAVRATHLGAYDYLTKPFAAGDLVVAVRRALEAGALRREVEALRQQVGKEGAERLKAQFGNSLEARHVVDQVVQVAASDFTVLILGQTGTGKELIAQAIHQSSVRRTRPFVALDCGAIPDALLESELFGHEKGAFTGAERRKEGRLSLADGGTCFLDEVGNLPKSLQAKLLRVLESRELQPVGAMSPRRFDVRFIAATNDDLQKRVTDGMFRADLYFRLAQYTILAPPLRDRRADIPYLTTRFLEEASLELRRPVQAVVPEAMKLLQEHPWPGNVRQLRNVIRQAVLQEDGLVIRANAIHQLLGQPTIDEVAKRFGPPLDVALREISDRAARDAERYAITETLRTTSGNKSRAARLLRTDYKTLHTKMRHLGIRAHDFTP